MVVGTVYNTWGRCVSIKYSLLWNNHTKYETTVKKKKIQWSVDVKHRFSSGCTIKNKWNLSISCIHTILWLYTGNWWGICVKEGFANKMLELNAKFAGWNIKHNKSNDLTYLTKIHLSSNWFPFALTIKKIFYIIMKAEKKRNERGRSSLI